MVFTLEQALVDKFVERLSSSDNPFGRVSYVREYKFQLGRPDVVMVRHKTVIAVEAKLKRWREAVMQASRNRCFAHESYVLLPKSVALRLERHLEVFAWHNVGLCYIEDEGGLIVLREPVPSAPIEKWWCKAATDFARKDHERRTNFKPSQKQSVRKRDGSISAVREKVRRRKRTRLMPMERNAL